MSDHVFGLLRPGVDAHTLGISYLQQLLEDSGIGVAVAPDAVTRAADDPVVGENRRVLLGWIERHGIDRLGFSYRLDPENAVAAFAAVHAFVREMNLTALAARPIDRLFFAGLPVACEVVAREFPGVHTFRGDETPAETLARLGVAAELWPRALDEESRYDAMRMDFARDLVATSRYRDRRPPDNPDYPERGTARDHLVRRINRNRAAGGLPLTRAHVGPYLNDREAAVRTFLEWTRRLARGGHLDVLSIGTSQLTQSAFGEDWTGRPNGGGVPLATEEEFRQVWEAARPMLVRTYAGTRNIVDLAAMYERTINIAWHALSLWWFCRIDGRGPLGVRENLTEHTAVLDRIAASGKPFEPNIPHHFAFRGGDEVSYVLSTVLAARLARARGIRWFVLQNMMNTPRFVWGVQDLARARVMLRMTRRLETGRFRVIYQPRAGLDYFSPDLDRARQQLAAATALMDDVEPGRESSPDVIHVVSYSEAVRIADPDCVEESVQITREALDLYRRRRRDGGGMDSRTAEEVEDRTERLERECTLVLDALDRTVPDAASPAGLYEALASGFLIAPYLAGEREEFAAAVRQPTRVVDGAVRAVDGTGVVIGARQRADIAVENYRMRLAPGIS